MAPSAISNDPVSQLETESTIIIEAAKTDVKSNPHFEPFKPTLTPITTEITSEDSTEPSSACDGFVDSPPPGLVEQEETPAPAPQLETESPVVVEAPEAEVESQTEPQIPTPAPNTVEVPTEIDAEDLSETASACEGFVDGPPPGLVEQEETPTPAPQPETESPVIVEAPEAEVESQTEPQIPTPAPITVEVPAEIDAEDLSDTASACEGFIDGPPPRRAEQLESPAQSHKWLSLNEVVPSISEPMSGAKKLRKMIFETEELIICPGVYDGLSARTAIELGFNAMYMTGAGTTASRLGQPDLAIAQLHEMRENAEMIANLDPFGPPLIADMDTGYGGPIMAARTVEQYIRSGVAGAHLEDQVLMKRCGHLGGKRVVAADEYIARIRAAHGARVRLQSDFVLIARTDALQSLGYDECISRLRRARDEGADVGLLEGFTSKEQAAQAVRDLAPWPLLLNSVENGKSPLITVEEARKMGFRIMIFSFATIAPAYIAIRETLMRLKNQGVVGTPADITPVKLFEVCGLKHSMAVDMNAGGESFAAEL